QSSYPERVVDYHAQLASSVGATAVPQFFFNGKPMRGAQERSTFEEIIDAEIEAANASGRAGREWIWGRTRKNNALLFDNLYLGKQLSRPTPTRPRGLLPLGP